MPKRPIPAEIKEYINETAKKTATAVTEAYRSLKYPQNAKAAYRNTEARLYAMPVLQIKIKDDTERIAELKKIGTPERSKSITRFSRTSVRIHPEEALEAIIKDTEASIANDQHEIDTLAEALEVIKSDPYFITVSDRYFKGLDNELIAEALGCDTTTVWRNRQRLVKSLSVRLYGTFALD